MKINLPYKVDPIHVTKDMCDLNGHMNVCFYHQIFEDNSHFFYTNELKFTDDHFASGFSTFTLEDNVRYLKEFLLDDIINIEYALNSVNNKLLHMIGCLKDKDGNPSAFWETILGHIDMKVRKIAPMDSDRLARVVAIKKAHDLTGDVPYEIRLKIRDL